MPCEKVYKFIQLLQLRVSMSATFEIVPVKTTAVTLHELKVALVASMTCHCIDI